MACKGPELFGWRVSGGDVPERGCCLISYNFRRDFTMANLSILPDSSTVWILYTQATFGLHGASGRAQPTSKTVLQRLAHFSISFGR